jgi:very-short-patch-repair endonuclease
MKAPSVFIADIEIICPEHGEFLVTPFDHIYRSSGCKLCKKSLLESKFEDFLTRKNITYIYACDKKHFKWLGRQHLDFYLPDYNIAVECQGEQHFVPKDFFGGEEGLIKRKKLDDEKYEKCKENGITLLYFYENNKFEKENNETIKKILEHDNKNRNY